MTIQDKDTRQEPDMPLLDTEGTADYEDPTEFRDSLEFDTSVIEKIVGTIAKEIPGILGMKGSFISDLTETFSSAQSITKGISADMSNQDVLVDMKVILEYGSSAPRIFDDLKGKVREGLLDMTGLTLRELNVRVVDVMSRKTFEDVSRKQGDQHQQMRQQQLQQQAAQQMRQGQPYNPGARGSEQF